MFRQILHDGNAQPMVESPCAFQFLQSSCFSGSSRKSCFPSRQRTGVRAVFQRYSASMARVAKRARA